MTRRAMITALLAGLSAAFALHFFLRRYELALGSSTRSVVVVVKDLALGELVARSALDFRELPERYVEERHVEAHDLERVVGTRSSTAIPSGSALLWTDLDLSVDRRSLSSLVRAGKRAFSLPARDVGFDGLLRPGDRVDVLFTKLAGGTSTLLQNVLVLTVGDDLGEPDEPSREPVRKAGSVTLSVGPEQAELLAESEGRGQLRLALRNPHDLALVQLTLATPASGEDAVPRTAESVERAP